MRRTHWISAAWSLLILGLFVPSSQAGSLGVAGDYNEFIFNDSTRSNVSTQGQVAVGNNATFNNFTIGTGINKSNIQGTNSLIVGGNLGGSQAVLSGYGNAEYGSKSINRIYYNGGGSGSSGRETEFFSSAESYLKDESKYLATIDANGTTRIQWGGITLSGTDGKIDVFNLSGSDLSKANQFTIDAPSTSTVVVNISGTSASMTNFGFNLTGGIEASHVLYNFYEATSLKITNVGVQGTVLAPFASVNFNNGQVNGNLIASSLSGTGTTLNNLFAGNLPTAVATPEPSSIAMVLSGCLMASLPALRGRFRRTS